MGKAKLIPLAQPQPKPQPDHYPFCLIEKSSLFQSGELSLRSENLKGVMEKTSLKMNIEDAQSMKIEERDMLELSTPEARTVRMEVNLSSMLARGVITSPSPCSLVEEGWAWVKLERKKKN